MNPIPPLPPETAGVAVIVQLAVAAVAVAYQYFRRPETPGSTITPDDAPTQLSAIGSPIPYIKGRHVTGGIHFLRGDRKTKELQERTGGKGGGGSKVTTGFEYREQAGHILGIGPLANIYGTFSDREGGGATEAIDIEGLFNGPGDEGRTGAFFVDDLNATYAPVSLSTFLGEDLEVYPGATVQADPPTWAKAYMGPLWTRAPGTAIAYWDYAFKGGTSSFPTLQYDCLFGDFRADELGVPVGIELDGITGLNPAYVLWEAMTAWPPLGGRIPLEEVDGPGILAFAELMEEEQIPLACKLGEGLTVGSMAQLHIDHYGIGLTELDGRIWVRPVRPLETRPLLDRDRIAFPIRVDRTDNDDRATAVEYSYSDFFRYSKNNTIPVGANAQTQLDGGRYDGVEPMELVNCPGAARKVAKIKRALVLADAGAKFEGGRDLERMLPGDQVDALDPDGRPVTLLVGAMEVDPVTGWCEVEALADPPLALSGGFGEAGDPNALPPLLPEPDAMVAVFSLPSPGGGAGVGVVRVRAHNRMTVATAFVSDGSGPYVSVLPRIPYSAGGYQHNAEQGTPPVWAAGDYRGGAVVRDGDSGSGLIWTATPPGGADSATSGENGPPPWGTRVGEVIKELDENGNVLMSWAARAMNGLVIAPVNQDYREVPDLTGDDLAYRAGELMVMVVRDGERHVGHMRALEPVAEPEWQPNRAYDVGESMVPAGSSTGFRYVCTAAGTSDATEPSYYAFREGQEVQVGTATFEARAFLQRITGIQWAQEGTTWPPNLGALDGGEVFIVERRNLRALTDARIAAGAPVDVKVVPSLGSRAVEIDEIVAVRVTPE